jgi:hypothetical protein
MSTYWDKCQLDIKNNSSFNMNLGYVEPLPHGEWDSYPVSQINNNTTASPAFIARSVNAAEVGPGPGTLSYNLPDGTLINIEFDMIFAAAQPTYVSAQAQGPGGANFTISITCNQDSWHGQGKRYYATMTLTAQATAHNSDTCTCT